MWDNFQDYLGRAFRLEAIRWNYTRYWHNIDTNSRRRKLQTLSFIPGYILKGGSPISIDKFRYTYAEPICPESLFQNNMK